MKKILFSLVLLCCAIAGRGQNDVSTATLQHGDEVKVFYGTEAFKQAVAAAEDGDAINLSAGEFYATDINKSLRIYGAGYEKIEEAGTERTYIRGGFTLRASEDGLSGVRIEGMHVNGEINTAGAVSDFHIIRCRLFNSNLAGSVTNSEYLNCVMGQVDCKSQNVQSLIVKNSYISRVVNVTLDSRVQVDHCIVYEDYSGTMLYTNSLLVNGFVGSSAIGENSTVYNCVIVANLPGGRTQENCYVVPLNEIFADGNNYSYSPERTFELNQPEVWIGTDGTQCGLYGGEGWSKVPATPVLKNMTVEVDGSTLKVNYEAQAR